MRLPKKSLFIVLIFALVILAGFSGKYNITHTEENRVVSDTELAIDPGDSEVFGEQDFSYSALAIPMASSTGGPGTISGGFMTLMEK